MENKDSKIIEYKYPKKKYLNEEENKEELEDFIISTNLTDVKLNPKAFEGIYLYGCDIEIEEPLSLDVNKVNIMRKARMQKCFQEQIKKYVQNYYISGLVLMGNPITDKKKLIFYLRMKEDKGKIIESEILSEQQKSEYKSDKNKGVIYKFKFIKNEKDLSEMDQIKKTTEEAQCIANYLNICLGKILKKCGYTKDRTTKKVLFYNKEDSKNTVAIENRKQAKIVFLPAIKAVCESYDGGNIFIKLLPKRILKTKYTFGDYFDSLKATSSDLNEAMKIFKSKVINKKGIKIYDQGFIKIEDVIYEDPYNITFNDKNSQKMTLGEYYTYHKNIMLEKGVKIPIAVRIIDRGGKLKGDNKLYVHIPCFLLQIIGNIFGEKINVQKLVQTPYAKLQEINEIRAKIEKEIFQGSDNNEFHNNIWKKFDPLTISGQIIKPPLLLFGNNIQVETDNGNFEFIKSSPYGNINFNNIDIYLIDLSKDKGLLIWRKLKEAGKELGISFLAGDETKPKFGRKKANTIIKEPTFYPLKSYDDESDFKSYISEYFQKIDDSYRNKEKKTDFIFMFMDNTKKDSFHYKIFKSTINSFNWLIPTQVILFDEAKFKRKTNKKTQFTNILCQMWAKKGNEFYICDFSFIPKTMVIAYSSVALNENKILTSIAISIGTKVYEYLFDSMIEENECKDKRISPTIYSLIYKGLKAMGKAMGKYNINNIENIVIYRDSVNNKQQIIVKEFEIGSIKKAIEDANNELEKKIYTKTKWCLILVSKINEIKMFYEEYNNGRNSQSVSNIPVGTIVDKVITNKDKYDFYLNSADTRQGTSSSTHYTVLYDDTKLTAIQIYKLTYYLTYLSYSATHSIRIPSPLYFVIRRNKYTYENLKGEIINPKLRTLNISL